MSALEAIQSVVHAALELWQEGTVAPSWCSGSRSVETEIWPRMVGGMGVRIVVIGPAPEGREGKGKRSCVFYCFPRHHSIKPGEGAHWRSMMAGGFPKVLIHSSGVRLYWPGPSNTELWTRTVVAIAFLQQPWYLPREIEGYVWKECLKPAFAEIPGGLSFVSDTGDGELGYEILRKITKHCYAPIAPIHMRAYLSAVVRNHSRAAYKEKRAGTALSRETAASDGSGDTDDIEDKEAILRIPPRRPPVGPSADNLQEEEQFREYLRQRKHRLWKATPPTRRPRILWDSVQEEEQRQQWKRDRLRRERINSLAEGMQTCGIALDSAKRTLRRWYKEEETYEGVKKRLAVWFQNRSKRSPG